MNAHRPPSRPLATREQRHAYAVELNARAEALWDLVFPPWRWLAWRREYRSIKAGVKELRQARLRAGVTR